MSFRDLFKPPTPIEIIANNGDDSEMAGIVEDFLLWRLLKMEGDQESLRRVKALVFMRLNMALDHRDHRAEKIYREIQEAMR